MNRDGIGSRYQTQQRVSGKERSTAAISANLKFKGDKRRQVEENIQVDMKSETSHWLGSDMSQQKAHQRSLKFQSKRHGYGFVSRGEENSLQRCANERQQFFQQILKEFLDFCNRNPGKKLQELLNIPEGVSDIKSDANGSAGSSDIDEAVECQLGRSPSKIELSSITSILSSLRKLREALLQHTPDDFTKRVYLFLIRLSALTNHYQTYLPCITYLLRERPIPILSKSEHIECSSLLVLHTCHFNNNHAGALTYFYKYLQTDGHDETNTDTLRIVLARVHGDYYTWTKLYNAQSDHARAALMRMGLPSVLAGVVELISKSYFSLDLAHLEKHILPQGVDFKQLQATRKTTWTCAESTVIVRPRNPRAK